MAPLDPVGPQGEGPDLPVIQHLAAQPAEEVTQSRVDSELYGQPCGQEIPPRRTAMKKNMQKKCYAH